MFGKKKRVIMVVHNDDLVWLSGGKEDAGKSLLRLPLERVLTDDRIGDQIPHHLKNSYHSLLIVPDHWFGVESYPFRSKKASLVEPFLEHKLMAAFPKLSYLRYFISYRNVTLADEGEGVNAYFLQESKSFQLYKVLRKLDVGPVHITAPAFLWMERLSKITPEFDRGGTLLIHMIDGECLLYFYFNGNYLFSRNVTLVETEDRLNALTFEINQSLYMFSQKTKSELSALYLFNGRSDDSGLLEQALGREVTTVDSLLDQMDMLQIEDVVFLNGLLQNKLLAGHPAFMCVSHKKVRQELEWKPIQWAGILIGGLLLLPLMGESIILTRIQRDQTDAVRKLQAESSHPDSTTLQEAGTRLDQILQSAERVKPHDAMRRLLASLPESVRVNEVDLSLDEETTLTLSAFVTAMDMDQLERILTLLVAKIRQNFNSAQIFSIRNIDIKTNTMDAEAVTAPYLISFKLDLI